MAVICLTTLCSLNVWAIPSLQLDTDPGMYDSDTQTTIATANPFTLRALLDGSTGLTRTYYISASIIPNPGNPPVPDFGSFTIGSTIFSSSSGMQYGYAPIDATLIKRDPGDLPKHGIFPTYFAEWSFTIDPTKTVGKYNVQDGTTTSGFLYYVDFTVNIAGLSGQPNSPYAVHFDLYDDYYHPDRDVQDFAPFSHDAESGHGITISPSPLPDGGSTIALLGFALLGVDFLRRRIVKA